MMGPLRNKLLGYLTFQRNLLAVTTVMLALTTVVLSCFLFAKQERVVVVPPVVDRAFWVESKAVSPTYLEQMGTFLSQLLLSKSTASAGQQRTILLRHTDPDFAGTLRKKLFTEEEELKKQNASYVFYPHTVQANPDKLQVLLQGDREYYISGDRISHAKAGYLLTFRYTGGRILLTSIEEQKA
ncbi:MAG: type IV conjugative transfer system protein TraE [Candidatus Obscuribacterales bacterium]